MYNGFFKKIYEDKKLLIKEVDFYQGKYAVFYDKLLKNYRDTEIFIRQASICGDKLLELACGAGRIGIPLAKAGFQVYGIDLSRDMLKIYEDKICQLPQRTKKKITLFHGDITDFKIDDKFDLIIFPATTICLFSDEQIANIFMFVQEHLKENGRFVFDRTIVNRDIYLENAGVPMFMSWEDSDEVYNVVWFQEFLLPDENMIEVDIYCEAIHTDGYTERFIGYTKKRIITDQIIDKVLSTCSLECIEKLQFSEEYQKTEFYIMEKR